MSLWTNNGSGMISLLRARPFLVRTAVARMVWTRIGV